MPIAVNQIVLLFLLFDKNIGIVARQFENGAFDFLARISLPLHDLESR